MVADGFEPRIGSVAVLEQIAADTRSILERLDKRPDRMEDRLTAIDGHHRADFRWMLGVMLAQFAGLLGAMAHGFHWL